MKLFTRIRSQFALHRADSAYARGDLASAHDSYREIVDDFEGSTRVVILNRLGMLSYALGDKRAAKAWYEQAIAIAPDEPGLHMNLANALDDLGEAAAARAAYERALAGSRRPDLLYNFAVLVAKSDPRAAIPLFQECLADESGMRAFGLPAELPLQNLVGIGAREGLFEEISRYLSELGSRPLGLEPWSVANQHAVLCSRSGRHDEALARFDAIFEKWPDSSGDVRYNLGMALIRVGRWESAREEFARVDHPMRHFGLAQVFEQTGPAAQAAREYRLFLEGMNEGGRDPIAFRAADAHADVVARAEAWLAAHPESPDDGSSPG